MKATIAQNIILLMQEHEAVWLKGVMQNPLWNETPETEDYHQRENREKLFTVLKQALDTDNG